MSKRLEAVLMVYGILTPNNTQVAHRPGRWSLLVLLGLFQHGLGACKSRSTVDHRFFDGVVELRTQSSIAVLRLESQGEGEEEALRDRCSGAVDLFFQILERFVLRPRGINHPNGIHSSGGYDSR